MFNFRKIASVLSSALMVGSTMGLAVAANYPAPYVQGGAADVAIVYGSSAALTDLVAVTDVTSNLASALGSQTASGGTATTGTVSGEAFPLFTGSSKVYLNSTLKSVRETVTDSELPILLADSTFEGDVSAKVEYRLTMGQNPQVSFAKQPTDNDDPSIELDLGTTATTQYVYNATVIFDKSVNFTHADSTGEDLILFGQKYSVSAGTTTSKLILFKSAQKVFLDSVNNPSESITIDGKEYTVELVSATDTAATVKITDSAGSSEQKEITEDTSKKVKGVEVSVTNADESTALNKITAEVTVGAAKLTLQDATEIKTGSDDDIIDGTTVVFRDGSDSSTTYPGNVSKIIFQVAAKSSDVDGVVQGGSFVDPVFGTFKVDFPNVNILRDSTVREMIKVQPSGSDKMTVTFTAHEGVETTVNWVNNQTKSIDGGQQLADGDADDIIVAEGKVANRSSYVVIGNENNGGLFEITSISNSSSGTASDDSITLRNVMTGESVTHKASAEGSITPTILGNAYTIKYYGASDGESSARQATFNFDTDSTGNDVVLFPTIQTSKGAKLAFYEPTKIRWNDWLAGPADLDGLNNASNVSNFKFPDGDGFTSIAAAGIDAQPFNVTVNSVDISTGDANGDNSTSFAIGKLNYNVSSTGVAGEVQVFLRDVGGANIVNPAIIIFEEKDDQNNYEALIIDTDAGYDGGTTADLGVADAERTWENDASAALGNEIQLKSNTDLYEDISWWGSIITLDKSDSNDFKVTVSYPDEQVYANLYVGAVESSVTGGATTGAKVKELGSVAVSDNELSSVSGKNLIVVGGSCVNSVAATLLGSSAPLCGADWESKTGAGSGNFLIETFARTGGKVATLVAGYNAGDTTNAVKYLTTQAVDTATGKKYIGTSSISATLQTTSTT